MIRSLKKIYVEKKSLKKLGVPLTVNKYGVTENKRKQEIIISLTSHPARINSVYKTIITLLNQDYLPDRVVLWLAKEQFDGGNEEILPKNLLSLKKYGLEIRWCEDIRSYKKLIPSLKEFPEALIITVDDDWYYSSSLVKNLMEEHCEHPNDIIACEITHPVMDENERLISSEDVSVYSGTTSYSNKLLGSGGVLYPANTFDSEIFNKEVFMDIAPTNDDIWFWGMAVKNDVKTYYPANSIKPLLMTDPESQNDSALALYNSQNNTYMKTTEDLFSRYPIIFDRIKQENNEKIRML